MFSLFHTSITQTLYPILMGIVLSVIMYKEDNILYCIIVHLINNFISLTLAYFQFNISIALWLTITIASIFFIVYITSVCISIKKINNQPNNNTPTKEDKFYLCVCLGIMSIIWIVALISSL